MANLEDSKSKLTWARRYLPELRTSITRFLDSQPYQFVKELSEDRSKVYVKLQMTKPIPREISLLVGDIIHNLRAALDYAACDLATLNGAENIDGVYFPFGKTKQSFEESAKGKMRKLSNEAKRYIHDLKPYRGGNEALWLVHYLDIGDKHRKLTPIAITGSTGAYIEHMTGSGISFAAPKWESLEAGMRVATIGSDTHWTGEISARTSMAFGEVQSIAQTPIEPLLEALAQECESVVDGLSTELFGDPMKPDNGNDAA